MIDSAVTFDLIETEKATIRRLYALLHAAQRDPLVERRLLHIHLKPLNERNVADIIQVVCTISVRFSFLVVAGVLSNATCGCRQLG
jgi:hypothetical protein